jgi:hypothetical protein
MAEERRNKPGRPPLDCSSGIPPASVHLKLPASVYDRASERARKERKSVQDVIRQGLTQLLKVEYSGGI